MKLVSEIDIIRNFEKSKVTIIRNYKFRKKDLKIVEIELFGKDDVYIRFSADVEFLNPSGVELASKFITITNGKHIPETVTVDKPELITNLMKDIREDTDDTQTNLNK